MLNAFTVDVEDYFQVTAFEQVIARSNWSRMASRVVENTQRLLCLLGRHDVRGTFFVLGWVARKFPALVREIHAAGHEIGSHSYWHRLIYSQTPDEFRQDLRDSKRALQDATGQSVTAFRAPSFSITSKSLWALDVLVEEGFQTDSSIFPTRHDRYGIPGARSEIHTLQTPSGSLTEFPPSVVGLGRIRLPVGGGGYFRLYPYRMTHRLVRRIQHRERRPLMLYIHPWEVDPGQPRIGGISRLARFRHYVNLATTERKLDELLKAFQFASMADVISSQTQFSSTAASAL